jgi:hypothetical protein
MAPFPTKPTFMNTSSQEYKNNEIRSVIKKLCFLNDYNDKVPNEIMDKVQLVINVSPTTAKPLDFVKVATSAVTLMTTSTTKDTYLTNFYITAAASAAAVGGQNLITCTIADGTSTVFTLVEGANAGTGLSGTSNAIGMTFAKDGILLKRGTTITTTLGASAGTFMIAGYTVDTDIYNQGTNA